MSALCSKDFLSTPEMIEVFGEHTVVQAMLDFEAALAHAQAADGMIPPNAAIGDRRRLQGRAVRRSSDRGGQQPRRQSRDPAGQEAHRDGGAVRRRRGALCALGQHQPGRHRHRDGARHAQRARADRAPPRALIASLLDLADREGEAPLLAHTLMQPAQVVSFGFRLATWIAPLVRARERLRETAQAALQLQLGGPVGTLSAMAGKGTEVAERMARPASVACARGKLAHAARRWVLLGCQVGVLCGSLGKIARDLSLMAQGEIGELAEPSEAGRGGSSAMPHKRNPVAAMVALGRCIARAATRRRAAGGDAAGTRTRPRQLASRAGRMGWTFHLRRWRC